MTDYKVTKNVEHVVDAFIHERHGADLNSDHPVGCRRRFGAANRGRKQGRADRAGRGDTGGGLEEFPTRDAGRRFRFHRLSGLQEFHAVSAATISYSRMPGGVFEVVVIALLRNGEFALAALRRFPFSSSAQRHDPAPEGGRGGLSAILDVQFAEDAVDVVFHGAFRDAQGGRDFLVAHALNDEF